MSLSVFLFEGFAEDIFSFEDAFGFLVLVLFVDGSSMSAVRRINRHYNVKELRFNKFLLSLIGSYLPAGTQLSITLLFRSFLPWTLITDFKLLTFVAAGIKLNSIGL